MKKTATVHQPSAATTSETFSLPRATDRRLYGKFEQPWTAGKISGTVFIPLEECPDGTTVTVTITKPVASK